MILNAYSVLALAAGVVELALGAFVVVAAASALRRRGRTDEGEDDARRALVLLAGGVLAVVGLASWPLLYLLLQSYVERWPDVMCVQGVLRVGRGALGATGALPALAVALQATKPLLVFGTGAWLLLHKVDRRTATAPLAGAVLGALLATGAVAALDGATQVAYVAIPKQGRYLSAGCCTVSPEGAAPPAASATPEEARPWLAGAYLATAAAMAWGGARAARDPRFTGPLLAGALVSVPVAYLAAREALAPALLGRPDHHCLWCLLPSAPLGVAVLALHAIGLLTAGWACVLRAVARSEEAALPREAVARSLLRASGAAWTGAGLAAAAGLAFA